MLNEQSDRVCTFFAIDHEAQIGFMKKLPEAAEATKAQLATHNWAFAYDNYLLRVPQQRFIFIQQFKGVGCQTLGFTTWAENVQEYGSLAKLALDKIGIKDIKRIGFKVWSFLLLGMSHSEMCDLLPGSYLQPESELERVCGKLDDALVQLHGTYKNMKVQLVVAPMTKEQAQRQFKTTANLGHFLESTYFDIGAKEFLDRLAGDCFYVDIDLFRKDVTIGDVQLFAQDSLEGAMVICENAVHQLKSLRTKKR